MVAVVAAVAGDVSSHLGTVLTSLVILLAPPIVGIADAVGGWLPTRLAGALVGRRR